MEHSVGGYKAPKTGKRISTEDLLTYLKKK